MDTQEFENKMVMAWADNVAGHCWVDLFESCHRMPVADRLRTGFLADTLDMSLIHQSRVIENSFN